MIVIPVIVIVPIVIPIMILEIIWSNPNEAPTSTQTTENPHIAIIATSPIANVF